MNGYAVEFVDGPLEGTRRIGYLPRRVRFLQHAASGATLLEDGYNWWRCWQLEREPGWRPLHYARVGRADVEGVTTYAFAGPVPACLVDDLSGYAEADCCHDPDHSHFWMPANWPGGVAPVRWQTRTPERDWVSVGTWVKLASGEVEWWRHWHFGSGTGDRWEPGTGMNDIRTLVNLEKKLLAEVAEHRAALDDLAETQALPGALPG